jgi:hypothetical protein
MPPAMPKMGVILEEKNQAQAQHGSMAFTPMQA